MKFVNRQQELKRLDRLARQKGAAVAVVWGRRRVGKTRLLLEWSRLHKGVYYVADESTAAIQRSYFATAIAQAIPGFSAVDYPDWATFFSRLAREAKQAKWRGPLVIDELPYLITVSPELPSILQKFIDHEAKQAKLILALCGSSQRMMQGAVLAPTAPLCGRADELIKLAPISIGYMGKALKFKRSREIIEAYSVWGGIPRYWELIEKKSGTLLEKIDQLVLDPMGALHEEPARLLIEESPSVIHLRPILDAIGLGANRLSEVATRIGQPVTSLIRPIQRLMDLDLIQREIPYGCDESNSKKALYKIKDPFVRFWFEVVASRRSLFSQVSPSVRIQWVKESLPSLVSLVWEELCRSAIPLLTDKLGGKIYAPAGRFWQGQNAEWDILSHSLDQSTFLIGEAKWPAKLVTASWIYRTFEELENKGTPPIRRDSDAKPLYVLFVPEKPKGLELAKDMKVIDARDVLRSYSTIR